MSTQPIDYAALADQARQQAAPKVDYSALAEQARTSAPAAKPSFFQRVGLVPDPNNNGAGVGDKEMQGGVGDAVVSGTGEVAKRLGAAYVNHGPAEVVRGAGDVLSGNISKGGSRIISGAGVTLAPLAPEAIAANPIMAARAMGGGLVGGKFASAAAQGLGADADQSKFAGDIGNVIGGSAAATGAARALFETPVKSLLANHRATLEGALDWIFSPKETLKAKLGSMAKEVLAPQEATPAAATQAAHPAAPPATSKVLKDAGVTQAMKDAGVAAPSASIRPVRPGITGDLAPRPDISFPPGLSGEDAANMQLTRYNINELRFMAQRRGLPVSPRDTHIQLIDKLSGSLTPDEVQGFANAAAQSKAVVSKFPENNAMAQNLNQAAAALQEAKGNPYEVASLRSAASTIANHPANIAEVDLTANKIKGVDKRIGKRINEFFAAPKEPDQAPIPLPETSAPQVPTGPEHMMELLRQSIAARAGK